MLIVCPSCTTSYEVAAASLGPEGRSVRCVKCRTVWHADPAAEPALAEMAVAGEAAAPAGPAPDVAAPAAEFEPPPGGDEPGHEVALVDPGARALAMEEQADDDRDSLADHESPSIAPDDAPHEPVVDIETLAARRARRRAQDRKRRLKPMLTAAIVVLTVAIGGILGWRADVVRVLPQTASLFQTIGLPVNLRGLEFSELTSVHEIVDNVTVLVIGGKVFNPTRQPHDVPRIRFSLLNAAGGEVYAWTTVPNQPVLPPGGSQTFRTRLASPPAEGRGVAVRFLNRRDAISGLK